MVIAWPLFAACHKMLNREYRGHSSRVQGILGTNKMHNELNSRSSLRLQRNGNDDGSGLAQYRSLGGRIPGISSCPESMYMLECDVNVLWLSAHAG